MFAHRVKIKPASGVINDSTKLLLAAAMRTCLHLKFTAIHSLKDSFIVVCTDDNEAAKLMDDTAMNTLRDRQFIISPSPSLLAKRSVFVKQLDKIITSIPTDELKTSIEDQNTWASVDTITRIPNASSMIKITFSNIDMATQALANGLAISYYHIHPRHIEPERFAHVSPCWNCYSYQHSTKDCPIKDKKFCSTCGKEGHNFKACTTTNATPTCLNCKGTHHTLAAKCPLRKEVMSKKIKEETKKNSPKSPTYTAISKLQSDTTRILQATQQSSLSSNSLSALPDAAPSKVLYCMMYAHLANAANPGTFNTTINELFRLNNMPSFNFPDSPTSQDFLKIIPNIANFTSTSGPNPNSAPKNTPEPRPVTTATSQQPPTTSQTANTLDSQPPLDTITVETIEQEFPDESPDEADSDDSSTPSWENLTFYTSPSNADTMTCSELYKGLGDGTVKYACESPLHFTLTQVLEFIKPLRFTFSNKTTLYHLSRSSFKKFANGSIANLPPQLLK
ncbi:uncharacterized protein [Cherax quadricarinatus]|uniref:uncharacterized protein n=1 Tax=Cherax quadricarinatus TaxID=27406 RepID=UPI00387E28FB